MLKTYCLLVQLSLYLWSVDCGCQWSSWSVNSFKCQWAYKDCKKILTRECGCGEPQKCSSETNTTKISDVNCASSKCPHKIVLAAWSSWSSWSFDCPAKRKRTKECVKKPSYDNNGRRECLDNDYKSETKSNDNCNSYSDSDKNNHSLESNVTPIVTYIVVGVVVIGIVAGCCVCCNCCKKSSSGSNIQHMSTYAPAVQQPIPPPPTEAQLPVYPTIVMPSAPVASGFPPKQEAFSQEYFDQPPPSYDDVMNNVSSS